MGLPDFILLRRIEKLLSTDNQWLIKTPENAPAFKTLGRYSRWRKSDDRFGYQAEILETHLDLLEFATRTGLFDRTRESVATKPYRQPPSSLPETRPHLPSTQESFQQE